MRIKWLLNARAWLRYIYPKATYYYYSAHAPAFLREIKNGCPPLDYVCGGGGGGKKNASNFEEHMVLGPLQILPGWKLFARDVTVVCEHN